MAETELVLSAHNLLMGPTLVLTHPGVTHALGARIQEGSELVLFAAAVSPQPLLAPAKACLSRVRQRWFACDNSSVAPASGRQASLRAPDALCARTLLFAEATTFILCAWITRRRSAEARASIVYKLNAGAKAAADTVRTDAVAAAAAQREEATSALDALAALRRGSSHPTRRPHLWLHRRTQQVHIAERAARGDAGINDGVTAVVAALAAALEAAMSRCDGPQTFVKVGCVLQLGGGTETRSCLVLKNSSVSIKAALPELLLLPCCIQHLFK